MNKYRKKYSSKNAGDWKKIVRPGWQIGYAEYRSGSIRIGEDRYQSAIMTDVRSRITLPSIWKTVEVEPTTLVNRVSKLIENWRFNRWEKEGAARRGIRTSLIEEGYSWQAADAFAEDVINRAYIKLGRGKEARPSFDEGQRWITRRFDQCLFCGEELPRRAYTGERRDYFCSDNHAERAVTFFELPWDHKVARAASRLIYRESQPLKQCQNPNCADPMFHPLPEADGKFCCRECKDEAQRTLFEIECADADCSNRFTPSKGHIKYCSRSCAAKNRPSLERVEKRCAWCNGIYRAVGTSSSMYCSPAHKQAAFKAAKRAAEPRLTPELFDGWFIVIRHENPHVAALFS